MCGLERRLIDRNRPVGVRGHSAGQMPRHDGRTRRFFERMTAEPKHATAVGQGCDDVAAVALHVGNLRPDDAEIKCPVKLQPATRELQMADLVASAAAEANGSDKMAAIAKRQPIERRDNRQSLTDDSRSEFDRFQGHLDPVKLVPDLLITQVKLVRPFQETLEIGTRRSFPNSVKFVTESAEPTGRF